MAAAIVRRTDAGFTIQLDACKDSMLDAEQAIQDALNQAGVVATEEALRRFDAEIWATDPSGLSPKLTSMGRVRKGVASIPGVRLDGLVRDRQGPFPLEVFAMSSGPKALTRRVRHEYAGRDGGDARPGRRRDR